MSGEGRSRFGDSPRLCLCLGLITSLELGCTVSRPSPWTHPNETEWRADTEKLERLRAGLPRAPYTATVTSLFRNPATGQVFEGRGAIAVAPGEGLRMILVGGAGATLLDAWVTPAEWRIAVPPLLMVKRGESNAPLDLPVASLRWWLLGQFRGSLFAAKAAHGDWLWLVRDGAATVELRLLPCGAGERIRAIRRDRGHEEQLDECRKGPMPSAGDWVNYTDATNGVEVRLAIEQIAPQSPDPAAFRDPDLETGVP